MWHPGIRVFGSQWRSLLLTGNRKGKHNPLEIFDHLCRKKASLKDQQLIRGSIPGITRSPSNPNQMVWETGSNCGSTRTMLGAQSVSGTLSLKRIPERGDMTASKSSYFLIWWCFLFVSANMCFSWWELTPPRGQQLSSEWKKRGEIWCPDCKLLSKFT